MMRATPAQLLQIAREERARRKAAWDRAGKADSAPARDDEIIWSNIEHYARRLNGDMRRPISWHPDHIALMADNIRATLNKAPPSFCQQTGKVSGLRDLQYALEFPLLYTLEHPAPVQPTRAAA